MTYMVDILEHLVPVSVQVVIAGLLHSWIRTIWVYWLFYRIDVFQQYLTFVFDTIVIALSIHIGTSLSKL